MEGLNDLVFARGLQGDVEYGFLDNSRVASKVHHPRVVLNADGTTVLRILREEIVQSDEFIFSVAFVTPNAIALLKQELVEFQGRGVIVTSDYLGFNSPRAFSELLNLQRLGIDVRIHKNGAFHPKGYIFKSNHAVTAMIGSSNLTGKAIVDNHEWNLKVSATHQSNLALQLAELVERQIEESVPLTQPWIDQYAMSYVPPATRPTRSVGASGHLEHNDGITQYFGQEIPSEDPSIPDSDLPILPNKMQMVALSELEKVRLSGEKRAVVISATGTGKTILSALEVRAARPNKFLFVVHREQILDKTIREYRRVLGGESCDYGKLAGASRQYDCKYVFATIQTLSQPQTLEQFHSNAFDYIIVDEAHRVGAETYQRVLSHLTPGFLLGLTATPERGDGFNVFEFFDYNVPYEIRLSHALEEDMLSPFHYYGITDVILDDDTVIESTGNLSRMISSERVEYIVDAISKYGQAGVQPRGLIFCAGKAESKALSAKLNEQELNGKRLRTVSLSGDDSIECREAVVSQLERGEIDYILTVDIFNEGVDIPSINQVIMLRQTKSAIVFVQQLGRGLRKAARKDYLVVIDFIGNYANNYLIPIALFGDESLNKESLKEKMISTEQAGVLAGLSSVRFDKISQQRVLESIRTTPLDSIRQLKTALQAMQNRVGGVPRLFDFFRFESVDPVLLATKKENYPALLKSLLKIEHLFSSREMKELSLLSNEVLTSKRPHELLLLRLLVEEGSTSISHFAKELSSRGLEDSERIVRSTIETFTLVNHAQVDQAKYGVSIVAVADDRIAAVPDFLMSYRTNTLFAEEVDDIISTGLALVANRYSAGSPFVVGGQYGRKEVTRLLGLPRKWTSTIYGYKVDEASSVCPIFVTLHKAADVSASTAYQDALLDPSNLRWFTRSRRTLNSSEVRSIVTNSVDLHVFVKKDDAEGTEFFYLGQAEARNAKQSSMTGKNNEQLDVVYMDLHFSRAIDSALFDYLSPNQALT